MVGPYVEREISAYWQSYIHIFILWKRHKFRGPPSNINVQLTLPSNMLKGILWDP